MFTGRFLSSALQSMDFLCFSLNNKSHIVTLINEAGFSLAAVGLPNLIIGTVATKTHGCYFTII